MAPEVRPLVIVNVATPLVSVAELPYFAPLVMETEPVAVGLPLVPADTLTVTG